MGYTCPCCGYDGLDGPAYEHLGPPPWSDLGSPPYDPQFGRPSYEVCACCGFEFGNDDNPGTGAEPDSFEEYREEWIREGCNWFEATARPDDWDLEQQLGRIRAA